MANLARTQGKAIRTEAGGGGVVTWGPEFAGEPAVGAEVAADTMAAVYEGPSAIATVSHDAAVTYANPAGIGTVTEVVYSATYDAGANSVANDGPDNWTGPNNATGTTDATNATRAGQALASTDANLRLGYANPSGGIETFTLTSVELRFWTAQSGTLVSNGGLHHEYRLDGGAWVSLAVFTGDVTNSGTTYDITAAVGGDWAKINALEVRVRAVLGIGTNLVTCSVDAVTLHFTATKTVTP